MSEINNFQETLRTYRETIAEVNGFNKTVVFDALLKAGIDHVTVAFDGSGDSGQIEEIVALTNQAPVNFPDTTLTLKATSFGAHGFTSKELSVQEAVIELCYGYLQQEHDGWEINDGAFGDFTLNVVEKRVVLNFNARFTDHFHSMQAF